MERLFKRDLLAHRHSTNDQLVARTAVTLHEDADRIDTGGRLDAS